MGRLPSSARRRSCAFAASGLVRLVEHGEVERLARFHCRGDDLRRLVGGEDDLRAVEGRRGIRERCALSVVTWKSRSVGRRQAVAACLHGRVGADAEMREGLARVSCAHSWRSGAGERARVRGRE